MRYKSSDGGKEDVIYIGRKLSVGIMENGDSLFPGVESACEAREPCRGLVFSCECMALLCTPYCSYLIELTDWSTLPVY